MSKKQETENCDAKLQNKAQRQMKVLYFDVQDERTETVKHRVAHQCGQLDNTSTANHQTEK